MMKPRILHRDAPDIVEDEPEAGSAVRAKRHRLDPRLDEIAQAARQGLLTEQEALDQIVKVMSELAGRMLPRTAQLGMESAMRDLARDPRLLAMLRDNDE